MSKDRRIINRVVREWGSSTGCGVVIPEILRMLMLLDHGYGEKVTVDGCCDALEKMSKNALLIRDDLRREQSRG